MQQITLSDIEQSSTRLPIIGFTLFWRLGGVRVSYEDLELALSSRGLQSHMPIRPTPRKALRRTLEAWISQRTKETNNHYSSINELEDAEESDQIQRTLIRVINKSGDDHMVFALVAEEVDFEALGLTYATDLRIKLHKSTGQIVCTTADKGHINALNESLQLANELQPFWEEFRNIYLAEDLSRMVCSIVNEMKAVGLRRKGGVYFVPADQKDKLNALRTLITSLPTNGNEAPYLCALGIIDESEAKRQLAKAVHTGIKDEVNSLAKDLQRFTEAPPGTVKLETVTERLLAYKELRNKVSIYADLLEMQSTDINRALDFLTNKAKEIVLDEGSLDKGSKRSKCKVHQPNHPTIKKENHSPILAA
jgi:hypothetical protein